VIRYNHFYDNGNSSLIFTGTDSYGDVYYNVFSGAGHGIGVWTSTQTGNINIYNNTITGATYPLNVYRTGAGLITAKNNIFFGVIRALRIQGTYVDTAKITLDYNRYWKDGVNPFEWDGTLYSTIAAYKTASSQDANSTFGDPLFLFTSDPRVQFYSPCVDGGTDVSLTSDYYSHPVHVGAAIDIGAFEWPYSLGRWILYYPTLKLE
jgi:hypothetical protein